MNADAGIETHGFLGEELLLWLWWKWETSGGEFTLPGGRVVGISLDDLLVFAAPSDDETVQTLRHGLPTRTAEGRTALRGGHRLAKARLLLAEGSRLWSFTLDGASLRLAGVKLPDDDEESTSDADRNADRSANWLALHEIVSALYQLFLRERLAPDWKTKTAEPIARWMAR